MCVRKTASREFETIVSPEVEEHTFTLSAPDVLQKVVKCVSDADDTEDSPKSANSNEVGPKIAS